MDDEGVSAVKSWTEELLLQESWHWDAQLRPRLEGLTDEEYLWEPVPGSWNLRPRAESRTSWAVGTGTHLLDFEMPEPEPPPVTTIAWRLLHVVVGVFGERNARYFGGPSMSYRDFDYPATAAGGLAALDAGEAIWRAGVASLDEAALVENCREEGFEEDSMAALVLHIHREIIHHGAEICLLRDLYAARG
ncbi:DinB family protein [Nakamurella sp. YIM 132087]|uniref:DinB family protein n=1 Tax=Nakamurella alba TaxID=2665158 RepID=A0A7K1FJG8_9ACTN|nr:DinB family protein [Nakamurella alba]MTD14277.1 DinB family protein [Nakamurella alba]